MRYLRTAHDFFNKHLNHVPFKAPESGHWPQATEQMLLSQQSWFLKAVAIELRLTSANRQRSHTQRLVNVLLDDSPSAQMKLLQADGVYEPDYSHYDMEFSFANKQSYLQQTIVGGQTRRKLLSVLQSIDFKQSYPEFPTLDVVDPVLVERCLALCEQKNARGVALCNVKKLHRMLISELSSQHGASVTSHRSPYNLDIQNICTALVERNALQESVQVKRQAFDAWRQVVEIVLTACPEDLLTGEARRSAIFELLQDLLTKVQDAEASPDVTSPVAGVLLTLLSNLRLCFLNEAAEFDQMKMNVPYASLLDVGVSCNPKAQSTLFDQPSSSITQYSSSLQVVLRGLIEYILQSSSSMQRVRVNLYGALLYYLQIAQKPRSQQMLDNIRGEESGVGVLLSYQDSDQLTQENMSTVSSYGENFMDIVCRDACDGHDVGRMLALSTLDALIQADKQQVWLTFMASKGYIQHIVDSLLEDNEQLITILSPQPQPLRALYIYQSKMSLLMRIAATVTGAHMLLQCSVMARLAECTVLDMRPDTNRPDIEGVGSLGVTVMSTYRDLLFPVLRLCLAVLTSTGMENRDARNHVLQFVMGHMDVFATILSDHQEAVNVAYLQELALVTAVISRAAVDEGDDGLLLTEMAGVEYRSHLSRIQHLMLALLPRYAMAEKLIKQIKNKETEAGGERQLMRASIQITLQEIVCNVTTFGRAIIANSARTAQFSRILFSPSLAEVTSRDYHGIDDLSSSISARGRAPSLGIVVALMKQSVESFNQALEAHKQNMRKLDSLPTLGSEELRELCVGQGAKDEKLSSQQQHRMARKIVTQQILHRTQELKHLSYTIENCLFIMWRHLDYFLVHCVPTDQGTSLFELHTNRQRHLRRLQDSPRLDSSFGQRPYDSSDRESSTMNTTVTKDQLDQLKLDSLACLNETLFKKLHDMEQCYTKTRSRYGFMEAIVRRLKGLLQLHATVRT